MFIKAFKLQKKYFCIIAVVLFLIFTATLIIHASFAKSAKEENSKSNASFKNENSSDNSFSAEDESSKDDNSSAPNVSVENNSSSKNSDYVKWFDFNVPYSVLLKTATIDITSHVKNEDVKLNWIELISYLACKYGNNFNRFKQKDLDEIVTRLKSGETISEVTKNMNSYNYYYECYSSVLEEFIGSYEVETANASNNSNNAKTNTSNTNEANTSNTTSSTNNTSSQNMSIEGNSNTNQNTENNITFESKYGIKAFHPIAKGYSYNHYDDFGTSRSYGYKRLHFGNDLMGSIGTPIIATESGVVEALGWNQYGGWRIGIRSFNGKRYYYYAHLRKDHPYAEDMYEGKIVKAGDVIGYLGMTGYSTKKNVNNINIPHLHFGLQLIFDESQKDGPNQIWVDMYPIVELLNKNRSTVFMNNKDTKDYVRKFDIIDPIVPE